MSGHTPGPWSVEQNGFYKSAVTANKGLAHLTWKAGTDRMSREEIEANARLIAAAPDLLMALENLENDAGQIPDHAWKIVKAAIAKARGFNS